ncbi:MAG: hypothetical protein WD750_12505 [Gammaproteobacteria bacterium]
MSGSRAVDPADPAKKSSEIVSATSDEATVQMDQLDQNCFWNDESFSQGNQISVDGKCYTCSFGRWVPAED